MLVDESKTIFDTQIKEELNYVWAMMHTPEQFGQPADLHPDTLPELIRTASRFIFGQF
ncbi:hypothetical protein [Aliarcobacter butzleri]|uniref:hypothetical protein n=1 Tax=Aliarcobacter butzleri TaxID=28197 RepID=UPI002B24C016|nr:hypothetical protein [Aliarcobacter butzleri]